MMIKGKVFLLLVYRYIWYVQRKLKKHNHALILELCAIKSNPVCYFLMHAIQMYLIVQKYQLHAIRTRLTLLDLYKEKIQLIMLYSTIYWQ